DIEDHDAPGPDTLVDEPRRRGVEMVVHFGPFQEQARRTAPLELVAADELVLNPLLLIRASWPGRGRDREGALGTRNHQPVDERPLPRARGPREHQQESSRRELERDAR